MVKWLASLHSQAESASSGLQLDPMLELGEFGKEPSLPIEPMQFTQQEEKLVKRFRKQERQWQRWHRWIFMVVGVFELGSVAFYVSILLRLLKPVGESPDSNDVLLIAILVTKLFINLAIGCWLLVVAFRDWHGNVNRMLLLKLLDAQLQQDEREALRAQP